MEQNGDIKDRIKKLQLFTPLIYKMWIAINQI
jgi:hypothetical protein